MDYEKAYKAVLQTATQWIKDGCTDKEKICLECVFPELRESEDERIRKELIEFIEWSVDRRFMREDFHQAKRPSEWLAYLEKHKYDRMQPIYDSIDSFESALDKAWKAYNDSGARTVDGCEDDYVECAHAKGFREGYLFGIEKQKEQKPAEWREEDIDASVKSYSDSLPMCGEFQSYHDALVHAYRQGMVNALKSLRPSWKPSEEQEEPEYYQHPV